MAALAVNQPQPVEVIIEHKEPALEEPETDVAEPEVAIIEPEIDVIEPEIDAIEPEIDVIEPEVEMTEEPEENIIEPKVEVEPKIEVEPLQGSATNFKQAGVLQDSQYRYTYYSSRVLRHYRTDEWTPGEDGIYRDVDGNVVVASSDMALGTEFVSEIFGPCKVYDSGCASGTVDVYVNF